MREPIDDERVRMSIARMRVVAFAVVSALLGAGVVALFVAGLGIDSAPAGVWLAACTTGALAWWAVPARWDAVVGVYARPALAGAANGALSVIGVVVSTAPWHDVANAAHLICAGSMVAVLAAMFGFMIGAVFGAGLALLSAPLSELQRRPMHTTLPWARCATGAWCAMGLGLAVPIGLPLPGASIAAGVLAALAVLVAIGSAVEVVRQRAFARRAERGEVAGWRVELDEEGTRWLVCEERGGEGAYREGVMSRRWARV